MFNDERGTHKGPRKGASQLQYKKNQSRMVIELEIKVATRRTAVNTAMYIETQ